ncbi:hypothetical protein ACQ4PT_053245 [Festuca glaucescens]
MVMKQQLAAPAAGVVALLALLALLEPAAAAGLKFSTDDLDSDASLWELYETWGARYNVARDPAEKLRRFPTFKETALRVASRSRAPGLNGFADLSTDEFNRDYKCARTTTAAERRNRTAPPSVKRRGGGLPLPVSWTWREKMCGDQPCLGPVKFQGNCGSCWAFAATGAMEAHHAIIGARNKAKPVQLSEQELVDCDAASDACAGGEAVHAFQYVTKNGIASSTSYPYMGVNGTCNANATPREDLIMRGFEETTPDDEYALLSAVTYGPVVVSMAVGENNTDFRDYEGGLYTKDKQCGNDWGDEGFLILPRPDTQCGMLREGGTYPNIGI